MQSIFFIGSNVGKAHISYCLLSSEPSLVAKLQHELMELQIIHIELLKMSKEEVESLMIKQIQGKTFTAKKNLLDEILANDKYLSTLGNPLYSKEYSKLLSTRNLEDMVATSDDINKYSILKQAMMLTADFHRREIKSMGLQVR